ncbi:MAG: hypothetical protein AAF735_01155 [Myxococcota bacterium]
MFKNQIRVSESAREIEALIEALSASEDRESDSERFENVRQKQRDNESEQRADSDRIRDEDSERSDPTGRLAAREQIRRLVPEVELDPRDL